MQVQFRFVEDHPATGTAATNMERPDQLATEHTRGVGVAWRWTRCRMKLAVENLGDEMIGDLQQVTIGRRPPRHIGLRHDARIASMLALDSDVGRRRPLSSA